MQVSLDQVHSVSVPRGAPTVAPLFVAENMPAPVQRLDFDAATVGPTRKILIIATVSAELEAAGPELASDIVGRVLAEAATRSLDSAVFDNAADNGVRPAGLLFRPPRRCRPPLSPGRRDCFPPSMPISPSWWERSPVPASTPTMRSSSRNPASAHAAAASLSHPSVTQVIGLRPKCRPAA